MVKFSIYLNRRVFVMHVEFRLLRDLNPGPYDPRLGGLTVQPCGAFFGSKYFYGMWILFTF